FDPEAVTASVGGHMRHIFSIGRNGRMCHSAKRRESRNVHVGERYDWAGNTSAATLEINRETHNSGEQGKNTKCQRHAVPLDLRDDKLTAGNECSRPASSDYLVGTRKRALRFMIGAVDFATCFCKLDVGSELLEIG